MAPTEHTGIRDLKFSQWIRDFLPEHGFIVTDFWQLSTHCYNWISCSNRFNELICQKESRGVDYKHGNNMFNRNSFHMDRCGNIFNC